MEPDEIFTALRDIRQSQIDNHTDVVQRLSRVETQLLSLPPLEIRVAKLEGWRNYLAGGFVVLGFGLKTALTYVTRGK